MEELYDNFTDEQKDETNKIINLLLMSSLDIYVTEWINSKRKITYQQIENIKKCKSTFILKEMIQGYTQGATVTLF